ncbi:MAG: hypothetical protein JXR96_17705 [Deltaproteobacteria bacterium]|nr:hypothetical protein [Deltaproteobacteria bacterium]
MNRTIACLSIAAAALASAACSTYQPGPGAADRTPYECTRDFAQGFEPLEIDGAIRDLRFSPDCRSMLAVDQAGQLTVTDLAKRSSRIVADGVQTAWFTADGQRVLFTRREQDADALYLAQDDSIHAVSADASWIVDSPDGGSVLFKSGLDPETGDGRLVAALFGAGPPELRVLAEGVAGAPAYSTDGATAVYFDGPVRQAHETPQMSCWWRTADMRAADLASGESRLLAASILEYGKMVSADGQHIYASRDYDCESQTESLLRLPLDGGPAETLAAVPTYWSAGHDLLETQDAKYVLHSSFGEDAPGEYRAQLWLTGTDGASARLLANDLVNYMFTCMYIIPFQLASERTVLYLTDGELDIEAVDLADGWTRTVGSAAGSMFFAPSPDGRSVLSLQAVEGEQSCMLLAPLDGGSPRRIAESLVTLDWPAWSPSGERILAMLRQPDAADAAGVYSVNVADGLARRVDAGAWDSFVVHPGGWLVALRRSDRVRLAPVP